MAKIIYCRKFFLVCSKSELNETEPLNLEHLILFLMKLYLKVWYDSDDASSSLLNDLNFLKNP